MIRMILNELKTHRPGIGEVPLNERSSAELKDQVKALGLNPEKASVNEMEQMIAMALWAKNHEGEEFPDQFDPMLAKDSTKADKDWIRKNFKSTDWWIQEKKDGMRSLFNLTGTKVIMTSRSRSVKDFLFTPHQDNVLGFKGLKNPFKGKTVLDGELMSPKAVIDTGSTKTASSLQAVVALVHMEAKQSLEIQKKVGSLKYEAYDILFFNGENVQNKSYEERESLVSVAVQMLKDANPTMPIEAVPTIKEFDDPYAVFQEYVQKGREGIMLKQRNAPYQQATRSDALQKLKGTETVDGFISGMVRSSGSKGFANLIGGFQISSIVDGKERVIANVSNIDLETRRAATVPGLNGPELNPSYLGKVVELIGQEFSKSGKLGSARINEWRIDRQKESCKMTSDDIKPKGR